MKAKRFMSGPRATIAAMCLAAALILCSLVQARAEQAGDVVYATNYPMFYTKGGDVATHAAGEGPLIGTTVFDGLIECGIDLSDLPALAESWKIADDWSRIDFKLRQGVKFHNGAEVTAEDVKYSLETAMRPELRHVLGHSFRQRIKEIEVIDKYNVRFHLKMPAPGLLKRLWWCAGIFPKKYREKVGDDGFADKPIGAGPFKWMDYKQDVYFKMEAVKKHYRKTPEIKTLKIVYVPEHSTRLAMLKAGEADIIVLTGAHIPQVKADPNLRLIQTKYIIGSTLAFADLGFPKEKSPFLDIRVRKAASLAIDRKSICEKILFGAAEPYGEVLSPYTLGWDPSVKPDPYDPEGAKKLLAEAGYPNGFETKIGTTPQNKYWIEAIVANLADVGIKAKLDLYEGASWWDAYKGKRLRGLITRNSWYDAERNAGADLQDAYTFEAPWCYYTTKEINDAVKDAMRAINDKDAAERGRKLSKLIRESRINIHTWAIHANYGVNKKIVKWERQLGSYPGTRFEYMKVKP